jgi:hypothetical protein
MVEAYTSASESSPVLDSIEGLYNKLERFVWWRAHQFCRDHRHHVLLEVDDVASEMFVTLVACWRLYHEKDGIDEDEMLRIAKASCDNTCRQLVITYYVTQKRAGDALLASVDDVLDLAEECDVERFLESQAKVRAFLSTLFLPQRLIVNAILRMDARLTRRAVLEGIRKKWVYKNPGPIKCNYRLVADAFGLEYDESRRMWYLIRKRWKEHQKKWAERPEEFEMASPTASEAARKFGKAELLGFCEELEIEVESDTHVYSIVQKMQADFKENGVPMLEDVSDEMKEFLMFMRYYTRDGQFVESWDEVGKNETMDVIVVESDLGDDLPECFGWGEPEWDGNCQRCQISVACVERRSEKLEQMQCYVDKLYDPRNERCKKCTMWRVCKMHGEEEQPQ